MKILLLGGSVFVGKHILEAALRRGHKVTTFTRGQTPSQDNTGVERLYGDRDGNLTALEGRKWDTVIDTSGYVPRIVKASAELLANSAVHYTFVSTISVYEDLSKPNVDEHAPVINLEDPLTEEVSPHYGGLKALCEEAVETSMPGRVLIVRPGLIVGPDDPTDRFTYWPTRVKKGGQVLVPGSQDVQVQFIDVRDLAEWIIQSVEAQLTGTYQITGPEPSLTMKSFLEACKHSLNEDVQYCPVSEEFLLEQGVGPWVELPLWIPKQGEFANFSHMMSLNINKVITTGITFRPLSETLQDTLAWDERRPADLPRKAGMKAERESELLSKWANSGQ